MKRGLLQYIRYPIRVQFPDDLRQGIKAATNLDSLLDVLADSKYWNCFDLGLLEVLVVSSGIQEAELLVQKYKDAFFPKKLSEILSFFPQNKEHKDAYISRVAAMIDKEPNEVTVGDLSRYCNILEEVIMDINNGSCVLEHLSIGQGHQSKSESGKAQVETDLL